MNYNSPSPDVGGVHPVLLFDLLVGSRDDHVRSLEHTFLGSDSTGDLVPLFELVFTLTLLEQACLLDPPRASGEHQHRVEQLAGSNPDRAGIGIVTVNHIRYTADLAKVPQCVVNELREMRR